VDAVADFGQVFGDDIDPGAIETTRFDIDQINAALAAAFPATGAPVDGTASAGGAAGPLPEPLGELVAAIRVPSYAGNCGACSRPPTWTSRCSSTPRPRPEWSARTPGC
jgi:hypothetical protein